MASNIAVPDSLEEMAKSKEVKEYIKKQLITTGQKGGLKGPEIIQDVVLGSELWLPDNGKLTAANKLNRSAVVKDFDKEIKVCARSCCQAKPVLILVIGCTRPCTSNHFP